MTDEASGSKSAIPVGMPDARVKGQDKPETREDEGRVRFKGHGQSE